MTENPLFKDLASIADLQWDASVKIEHVSGFDRCKLSKLGAAGLLPSVDKLPENLRYHEDSQLSPQASLAESTAFDLLGEYDSAKRKIIIYDDLIKLAAIALDVDREVITAVVLAHEVAHAITHLAKDAAGAIWQHFAIALTGDKELFAQIYPHLYFIQSGQTLLDDTMLKLCERQPAQYSAWKDLLAETTEQINARLLVARRKSPSDFHISRSFMGFGVNMFRSRDDQGLILSDGRAFLGANWGMGFQLGEQCPGTVRKETINALREAIVNSGVMNISDSVFGPEAFMDGGITNMEIRVGDKERSFEARCGEWDKYSKIFGVIERIFAQAIKEATRP